MTKYIILFTYIAFNTFLLILNWPFFSQTSKLDFGFSVYYIAPFIMLQIVGLLSIIALAVGNGYKDLKYEIEKASYIKKIFQLEKDAEITGIKNQMEKMEKVKQSAPVYTKEQKEENHS